MALKFIAVQGCEVSCSDITGGSATISTPPSLKVKADTKNVYKGTLSVTWAGGYYVGVPAQTIVTAVGSINPTSMKVKADGSFVIREGDSGSLTGAYTNPSGTPPTLPFSSTIEISDAANTKVKGE